MKRRAHTLVHPRPPPAAHPERQGADVAETGENTLTVRDNRTGKDYDPAVILDLDYWAVMVR